MIRRECCFVDDDGTECRELSAYGITAHDGKIEGNYTESCTKHLEQMLDDSETFTIERINHDQGRADQSIS